MALAVTIALVAICCWFIDLLFLRKRRSLLSILPGPPSEHIIFGNEEKIAANNKLEYLNAWANTYGGVVKMHSLIGLNYQLLVSDPASIHSILIDNNSVWPKARLLEFFNRLFVGQGITSAAGEVHRRQRKTLLPIFSTQQMRAFLPRFFETSRGLCKMIQKHIAATKSDETTLDALRFTSQIALDIVGNSAIGYDFDTIKEDSEYSRVVKELFPTLGELGPAILLVHPTSKLGSWSFRRRAMETVFPWLGALGAKGLKMLHILDVMEAKSLEIFNEKKQAVEDGKLFDDGPKDVITTLLKGSRTGAEDALEDFEILSQIQTMVFALIPTNLGHETTSTVMTRCLQALSMDQDLQERLRLEFAQARLVHGDGDLDHETLQALPLLDGIIKESLRLFAPLPITARENAEDTILPLTTPIKSTTGQLLTEVFVPKGTFVQVAIDVLNHSKLLFGEDADEFKPDRWFGGGPTPPPNVKNPSVYSSILTFSGGIRGCLGFQFAVLELKVVIYSLINAFVFSPARPADKIEWRAGAALYPVVRGQEDRGPQLPMKVRVL